MFGKNFTKEDVISINKTIVETDIDIDIDN